LGLKEIAMIAGVPPGVLRVWRTEEVFKKEEREACDEVGEMIKNSVDIKLIREEIESIKKTRLKGGPDSLTYMLLGKQTIFKILKSERQSPTPFIRKFLAEEVKKKRIKVIEIDDSEETLFGRPHLKIDGYDDPDEMIHALARYLLYFNPLVAQPLINVLGKKIGLGIMGYLGIASTLLVGCHVRDEKSLRQWRARPQIKNLTKAMIKSWIEEISNPEAREVLGAERVQKSVEDLKTFIFQELDL